jgi:hypothetical protein
MRIPNPGARSLVSCFESEVLHSPTVTLDQCVNAQATIQCPTYHKCCNNAVADAMAAAANITMTQNPALVISRSEISCVAHLCLMLPSSSGTCRSAAPTSEMLHTNHGSSEPCECVQHVATHLGVHDASTCMCTLTSAKTSVKVPPRSIEKRSVLPSLAPSIADQTYRWGNASSGTALHLPQKLDAC